MKKVWVAKTAVFLILTLAVLLSFTVIANATREQNIGGTSEPAVARVSDSKIGSVDAVSEFRRFQTSSTMTDDQIIYGMVTNLLVAKI